MTTLIHLSWLRTFLLVITLLTIFVGSQFLPMTMVEAQSGEPTMEFNLMKKFSGPYPVGYTADQFTFNIEGTSASGTLISLNAIVLDEYTVDTATAVVNLPMGVYTISENGPGGFVPDDWVVQWTDPKGCVQQTSPTTTIIIDENNFGLGNVGCRADNQWFPDVAPVLGCTDPDADNYDPAATADDGTCEYDNPNGGQTGTLIVQKIIINNNGGVLTADDFSFSVNGATTVPFESDGSNSMTVATGTYTVVESPVPTGYSVSYSNCLNVVVDVGETETCIITNNDIADGGNGGGNLGTLIVEKIVVGGIATTTDFSFSVNGSTSIPFEADGSNEMAVASGTYSVVEIATSSGYTVSYNNCTDLTITHNTTVTCTITNTYNSNGGGNGGDKPTYLVFGYVWHDENANTQWETDEPNPADDEVDLDAWTVQITNGSTTFSTTTDATGYYYFYVEAGTWTINEVLQSGWTQTFPVVNGHLVVVIDESITKAKPTNFFASVRQFLIPIAYAQTTTTYGPFDFGNVYYGTGGGGNDGGGGNGGSGGSSGSSGGGGGTPTVLGEAINTMPLGAPDTGAGGTSPISFGFQMPILALPSRKIYWS